MAVPIDIKMLIVGSDYIYRKGIKDMLNILEFKNIEEAADGPNAWEILNRVKSDIVISQWDMPEMSGISFLKLIRRDTEFSDTPVILRASQITKLDVIKAGEAGASTILVDPVTIEKLEDKINYILEFEMNPSTKQAKTYMARGDQYMHENRFEDALREYKKILDILESAEVYYNIGYIKTAQGEYDEALAAFRKATQINQMFAKAYTAMAAVFLKMDDKKQAEAYLQKAGDIYMEREMHENAENIFNEILKINPDTINVYNSLGILYRKQDRYKDALVQYQKAAKIAPDDENIHFNMGRVYLELNNPDMAKNCFKKALMINPRLDMARGMLKAIEPGSNQ
ncbi:MAG: tetratricopeptide repeat protein [Thermodesulfobacteriota bacterium]|nr:tetratricopeptide repeat protein [Thermodesulfobacteriota bacterium]